MKVVGSQVAMTSRRAYAEGERQQEAMTVWKDGALSLSLHREGARGTLEAQAASFAERSSAPDRAGRGGPQDVVAFSEEAQRATGPTEVTASPDLELRPIDKLNLSIVRKMMEALTGEVFALRTPAEVVSDAAEGAARDGVASALAGPAAPAPAPAPGDGAAPVEPREGWGMTYDYYAERYESESTSFTARGVVQSADGREIAFTAELNMSREFVSREQISVRAGDALKDPLVVNFDGRAAELTETTFRFDIDVDGREDQIAFVGPQSAFLALDKNGDGRINDGSELFGATSGDGFADLAAYDSDVNGWIDEADAVYLSLRLWSRDAAGTDTLIGLGQAGVGAVYLGHVGTQFALKDADNALAGQVRSTGLYLRENGQVGTVQQVDLAAGAVARERLDITA